AVLDGDRQARQRQIRTPLRIWMADEQPAVFGPAGEGGAVGNHGAGPHVGDDRQVVLAGDSLGGQGGAHGVDAGRQPQGPAGLRLPAPGTARPEFQRPRRRPLRGNFHAEKRPLTLSRSLQRQGSSSKYRQQARKVN
ncbi:hypothetical protein STRTUCAR8_00057, partial [Streptomyces turgidiscabies Car8]